FTSDPEPSSPSGCMPRFTCASTSPGSSHAPSASRTCAPAGTSACGPSAVMTEPVTTRVPVNGSPMIGTTCALVIAKVFMGALCHGLPRSDMGRCPGAGEFLALVAGLLGAAFGPALGAGDLGLRGAVPGGSRAPEQRDAHQ